MTTRPSNGLPKAATGIQGLDELTHGGFPAGRPTLVCGAAGCGKTMLGLEFLVRGATQFDEPGVFMMFEENADELASNVRSLGFDLHALVEKKKLVLDHVHVERSEIDETGEYDLEGLFIRLGHAVDSIGAKRVVLDTLEALFASLPNEAVLRAELRRLFRWLKDRGLTAVVTGERGKENLTRYGLEEYVADCVILLDHRVREQISTRRLRIVKYRGSSHGTNEYPFMITNKGFSVLPITSLLLEHTANSDHVPTGIADLDDMMRGGGFHRGSSILVSGSAGSGKSSVAAAFLHAACGRGERAVLFAYEESPSQIVRNMRSIGYDLEPFIQQGLLSIHATRPTLGGLEQHLVTMHQTIVEVEPAVVVVDPISNLTMDRQQSDVKQMLIRLIDLLKVRNTTALFTSLMDTNLMNESDVDVASLMDTWLLLSNKEINAERSRTLVLLKARGIAHSNQVREFVLSDDGIRLLDIHVQDGKVVTGRARIAALDSAERATAAKKVSNKPTSPPRKA